MAFINKRLTKEEREEFKARKIIDFRRTWSENTTYVDPMYVTVDTERGVYLISLGSEREEYFEVYFVFILNNIIVNVILHKEIQSPHKIIWSIKKVNLQNENAISNEKFYQLLKDALMEFRWDGSDDVRINGLSGSADVNFKF